VRGNPRNAPGGKSTGNGPQPGRIISTTQLQGAVAHITFN
jgi:hypothetical protein